jgi:hypothetical protein
VFPVQKAKNKLAVLSEYCVEEHFWSEKLCLHIGAVPELKK